MSNSISSELGGVRNISFNLTSPMKMVLGSMDVNSINLFCGANGSGKTFLNKVIYFVSMMAFMRVTRKFGHIPAISKRGKIQYLFDNIFTNPSEISGVLMAEFENGKFECYVTEGIVTSGKLVCNPDVKSASYPKYMSTTTRTFSAMEMVLALDKMMPNAGVLNHYKLYDLLQCHLVRDFALTKSVLDLELRELLKSSYDMDVISVEYDENECKFSVTDSAGKKRLASSLSAGHQSLLNIMLTTYC